MSLVKEYGDTDRAIKSLDKEVAAWRARVISLADPMRDTESLSEESVDDLMMAMTKIGELHGHAVALRKRRREIAREMNIGTQG